MTAVASVSVTVDPEMEGLPLSVCVVPPLPFFTVKAPFAREAAAPRSSLKVITSDVPFTVAETNVGFVVSTLWLDSAACAAWSRSALRGTNKSLDGAATIGAVEQDYRGPAPGSGPKWWQSSLPQKTSSSA